MPEVQSNICSLASALLRVYLSGECGEQGKGVDSNPGHSDALSEGGADQRPRVAGGTSSAASGSWVHALKLPQIQGK